MSRKVYVDVAAAFDKEGKIIPMYIKWEDDRTYYIDRVLDIRPAASLKAGGAGIRYTCRIQGKETYLFLENYRWFVEGKQ